MSQPGLQTFDQALELLTVLLGVWKQVICESDMLDGPLAVQVQGLGGRGHLESVQLLFQQKAQVIGIPRGTLKPQAHRARCPPAGMPQGEVQTQRSRLPRTQPTAQLLDESTGGVQHQLALFQSRCKFDMGIEAFRGVEPEPWVDTIAQGAVDFIEESHAEAARETSAGQLQQVTEGAQARRMQALQVRFGSIE